MLGSCDIEQASPDWVALISPQLVGRPDTNRDALRAAVGKGGVPVEVPYVKIHSWSCRVKPKETDHGL